MKNIFSILCLTMMVFSCADKEQKRYVPKSSGNINNLVVVADNQLYEDSVGEAIRDILAAPVEGLSKEEPMFSMNQMPTSVFSGFAKKNRLILKIEKGKDAEVKIGKDTFARPQALVVVSGQTNQEIIDQLKANAAKIIDVFNKEEIKEKQRRISKSLFKDEPIENQLGLSMKFPTAYRIAKHDNNFFWLRRDIETGTVDIMLYEVPLSSIRKNDSTVLDVVRVRDSVGKIHIEGYMGTEDAFTPFISKSIIDNKPAFETKGLWDVKNAFMSGPFINYAIEDKLNNRFIIAEGYVFAPSVKKRDYVFELEAIINSIQIE